jgi:hypothetical protein
MKIRNYQLLFKAIVGSHSYGTNVEGSDIDYKGVYIQTPRDILYEGYQPQIEIGKDETYYELGRFLALCDTANPTVLELLYTPEDCVVYKHPLFDLVLEERQKFLTKKCRLSFGGYAIEQIRKARGLNKKMNWEKEKIERKDILDFCFVHEGCGSTPVKEFLEVRGIQQEDVGLSRLPHMRDCFAMFYDCDGFEHSKVDLDFKPSGIAHDPYKSNDVSLTSISKVLVDLYIPYMMYFNKDAYSTHCKEYKEYQTWLQNRNVQRYVDVESHGQQIDGKNMLHCVRLLQTAAEIPKYNIINVRRPNSAYLVEIRKGKHNLEELLEQCELDIITLDNSFNESKLPDKPEDGFTKKLTIKVREAFRQYE